MDTNVTTQVGRIGRDPETKFTADGKCICKFSIAVNGYGKDDVSWFDVTAFGKTAEFLGEKAAKGCRVCISGRLQQEKWEDKDGNKRSKVGIIANQVQMLTWADDQPRRDDAPAKRSETEPAPSMDGADDPPF